MLNGMKRKAEDSSPKQPEKLVKPNPTSASTNRVPHRPAAPPLNAPKPSNEKILSVPRPKLDVTAGGVPTRPGSAPTTPTTSTPKAPPKGSYADLMARAKQAQTEKAQTSQVGMIKHQPTQREKVSKVAERRRQEDEKAKAAKGKSAAGLPAPGGKPEFKSRSVSPAKKTDQPKVPKAPRPPLHAPPSSSYKGTLGKVSSRAAKPPPKRSARYDDYLGTDEEDASDDAGGYGADEVDDCGSEASSDMEAGAFDLDEEENKALKYAKEEDAREAALENQLKREKEERRKRLMGLANKRK